MHYMDPLMRRQGQESDDGSEFEDDSEDDKENEERDKGKGGGGDEDEGKDEDGDEDRDEDKVEERDEREVQHVKKHKSKAKKVSKKMVSVLQQGEDNQPEAKKHKSMATSEVSKAGKKVVLKKMVTGSVEQVWVISTDYYFQQSKQELEIHEENEDRNDLGVKPIIKIKKCHHDSKEGENHSDTMATHRTKRQHFVVSQHTKEENDSDVVVHHTKRHHVLINSNFPKHRTQMMKMDLGRVRTVAHPKQSLTQL
ncbi:hypothetical protein PAXRUDRAFT_29011 [Paxillus rubicundulus Ve08.2h10]|uniref:Uncharacterized protein n=1 Tax=Paxillus rubicundulus Ve08.2h10 TaxID=930991 RepID=A0A0D0DEQ4_9AGAM|nr:hypothetical protein PAXRUDRAFT_29011 [Paxillus rubicundulus Ve08.2h10]